MLLFLRAVLELHQAIKVFLLCLQAGFPAYDLFRTRHHCPLIPSIGLELLNAIGLPSKPMSRRNRKLVLLLVTLALAIAPLRAALPVMAVAVEPDHCEQMQEGMQDVTVNNQDHSCDQGCGGDCCGGACNACAHSLIALSGPIPVTLDNHESLLNSRVTYGVSDRTVHPPFRPPISLQS